MRINKCDVCKKHIKDKQITLSYDREILDICEKCGKPIIDYLKKEKLVRNN